MTPSASAASFLKASASSRTFALSSPGNHLDYKPVRRLGSGSFGTVVAARNLNDGKVYALKTIVYRGSSDLLQQEREHALKEVRALRLLSDHPCVVQLHDAYESANARKLHIVAEFCESGSLEKRLDSARRLVERNGWQAGMVPEKLVSSWMFQLAAAIEHLHIHNCLHRDIKPANIFLSSGGSLVKLGDFGLVGILESSMDVASSNVGTPCYNLTPELLRVGSQSYPGDMWSLGTVLFECLTLENAFGGRRRRRELGLGKGKGTQQQQQDKGECPKDGSLPGGEMNRFGNSIVELGKAVLEARVDDHERLASYSAPLRHICSHKGCLSRDPDARPTASGLLSSRWGVRTMRAFLSHKHISKPPAKLISLVKERVLLAAAAEVLETERKQKARK